MIFIGKVCYIIAAWVIAYWIFVKNGTKNRLSFFGLYSLFIFAIIAISFVLFGNTVDFSDDFDVFVHMGIFWIVMSFGLVGMMVSNHECPKCHSINRSTEIETLAEREYTEEITVKKDIHNNSGKVVGYIEESEDIECTEYLKRYKCNECGHIYEKWVKG